MAADPYLAVTLDAKRRIAQVARALDQSHPGPAAWGLLELLEDVWRRKDPAVSALVLTACFGPDPRWPAALVEIGFLVVRGVAWELCAEEADRLLLTHSKRVAAGKARAASAVRDRHGRLQHITSTSPAPGQQSTSTPPAADQLLHPAPSTQQQDHSPSENPRAAPAGIKTDTSRKKRPAAEGDPRVSGGDPTYKALVEALFAAFRELRGGADYDPSSRDWKALQNLRARHDGAEIVRRWRMGLQAAFKARCDTLVDLEEKWNAQTTPATAVDPAKPKRILL